MEPQNGLPCERVYIPEKRVHCWRQEHKEHFANEDWMERKEGEEIRTGKTVYEWHFLVKIKVPQYLPCVAQRET